MSSSSRTREPPRRPGPRAPSRRPLACPAGHEGVDRRNQYGDDGGECSRACRGCGAGARLARRRARRSAATRVFPALRPSGLTCCPLRDPDKLSRGSPETAGPFFFAANAFRSQPAFRCSRRSCDIPPRHPLSESCHGRSAGLRHRRLARSCPAHRPAAGGRAAGRLRQRAGFDRLHLPLGGRGLRGGGGGVHRQDPGGAGSGAERTDPRPARLRHALHRRRRDRRRQPRVPLLDRRAVPGSGRGPRRAGPGTAGARAPAGALSAPLSAPG